MTTHESDAENNIAIYYILLMYIKIISMGGMKNVMLALVLNKFIYNIPPLTQSFHAGPQSVMWLTSYVVVRLHDCIRWLSRCYPIVDSGHR